MATREDLHILKVIKQKRQEAKQQKQKIPFYLSDGESGYESAIMSIVNAGAWATAVSIFTIILSSAIYILSGQWGSGNILFYVSIACLVACAALGFNLYWLRATPKFILVSLIFILFTSLIACSGIFPLVTAIFAIGALIHWSTYKDWFYSMRPTRKVKPSEISRANLNGVAKTVPLKSQPKKSLSATENKKPIGLIISLIITIVIAIGGSVGCYFWGKYNGSSDGYGFGYEAGFSDGRSNGWNNGWNNGYNSGYNTGHNDGYKYAGCVIWGGAYCIGI